MADEIPTEALEAGIALARATKQVSLRPDRDIWVSDLEMELIRAAIRGAAPVLIAEGRRQALRYEPSDGAVISHEQAEDTVAELRQSATIMAPSAAARYHAIADDLDAGRLTPSQAWQQLDETPALMARYERQLRAKVAAEIRARAGEFKGVDEAGDAVTEWAARIAEETDHG